MIIKSWVKLFFFHSILEVAIIFGLMIPTESGSSDQAAQLIGLGLLLIYNSIWLLYYIIKTFLIFWNAGHNWFLKDSGRDPQDFEDSFFNLMEEEEQTRKELAEPKSYGVFDDPWWDEPETATGPYLR